MPYTIQRNPEFVEVTLHRNSTVHDLLRALEELTQADPRKETCDLWVFPDDMTIPFESFGPIADKIRSLCRTDFIGSRSAMVATGVFQLAQMELYRQEAATLPYELVLFPNREAAIAWLKEWRHPTRRKPRNSPRTRR